MKKIIVLLTVLMIALMSASLASAVPEEPVFYVDDDYTTPEACSDDGYDYLVNCFHTIQSAVDMLLDSFPAGDVLVGPGTYHEDVVLSGPITLVSTHGSGATIISGSVFITETGATVEGFTVHGGSPVGEIPDLPPGPFGPTSIPIEGTSVCILADHVGAVDIRGNEVHGCGIGVSVVSVGDAGTSYIEHNHLHNNDEGLSITGSTSVIVRHNLIENNLGDDSGVHIAHSTSIELGGNVVGGNVAGTTIHDSEGVVIHNSLYSDNSYVGILAHYSLVYVLNSDIFGSYYGVEGYDSYLYVNSSRVHDNGYGIETYNGELRVFLSHIFDNHEGIYVGAGANGEEFGEATATINTNNIFNNEEFGLETGIELPEDSVEVDAEGNYWGCPTGPNTLGCDTVGDEVEIETYLCLPFEHPGLAELCVIGPDGILELFRLIWGLFDLPVEDSDGDGLPDSVELSIGTDPENSDTDSDGIFDGADPHPTDWDANNNGIPDGVDPEYPLLE